MKTRSLAAALLCLFLAGLAQADLPGPRPRPRPAPVQPLPPEPKVPTYPLVLEVRADVAEAKLEIPRKMLGMLKGELQLEEANPPAIAGTPRLHTIIAGSALALGLSFGGLWLVRRGQVSGRTLGLVAGATLFLGIGAAVWADRAPARPRPAPQINAPPRSPRMNNVVIEVVDKGDAVKLVISADKLQQSMIQLLNQQMQQPNSFPAPRK